MSVTTQRLSTLRRTAYREAGRAAMCIIRHRGFVSISIVPKGESNGGIRLTPIHLYDKKRGHPDPKKAEREVVIDMAGPIAEKIARGQRQWRGTGSDLLSAPRAIELASQVCESHDAARAYLKYLWLDTRDALLDPAHWSGVQVLAADLIDRRRLTAHRARELFRKTLENAGR
jgi:hypothetical protein